MKILGNITLKREKTFSYRQQLIDALASVQPEEALFVSTHEWKIKTTPLQYLAIFKNWIKNGYPPYEDNKLTFLKTAKFITRTISNGWIIKRKI